MFIRGVTFFVACIATIAVASSAAAQGTTPTRDTMHMQMQHHGVQMTAQVRDSLIAQLLDSANRAQDPMIAQRLRDSVTTLRSVTVGVDTMGNRMMMQRQQTQQSQQQQRQQAMPMQQSQPSTATSDQRVRIQKDGRP